MSIKIISKGIDPKTIPLRGTCYTCKTVVECAQKDAVVSDAYDCRDQRSGTSYTVACPVCNSSIYVTKHVGHKYEEHDGRGPG